LECLRDSVEIDADVPEQISILLHDAQTSGGLLLAVPPDCTDLLGDLIDRGVPAAVAGRVLRGIPGHIRVLDKEE
jgi:selenide, water dikinase